MSDVRWQAVGWHPVSVKRNHSVALRRPETMKIIETWERRHPACLAPGYVPLPEQAGRMPALPGIFGGDRFVSEQTKDLSVEEFTTGMRQRLSEKSGLDATIKFVFDEGGIIFIDGKNVPHNVSNEDNPADVTMKMSLETMNKLQRKELNGMMAVMAGKIKLEGNMMAAMKLDQILG